MKRQIKYDKSDYLQETALGLFILIPMPVILSCELLFGDLVLNKSTLFETYTFAISIFLLFYAIYLISIERNYKVLNTSLSKAKNNEALQLTLIKLNWSITAGFIKTKNGFINNFIDFRVEAKSNGLYYNMITNGTLYGRFPFSFGIKTYVFWKFKRTFNKIIKEI